MADQFSFKGANALLDTNILKEMTLRTKRSASFRPVFDFMAENEMNLFILDATKFEFVGYSSSKKDYEVLEEFIGQFWSLPILKEDVDLATKLASMYKCKNPSINPKQISFVDCLHATQILKYRGRALVVTSDINDYPSFLFDMPQYMAIEEEGGNTSFVGFKSFNEEKLKTLEDGFSRSG